jgi:hypothetical protein
MNLRANEVGVSVMDVPLGREQLAVAAGGLNRPNFNSGNRQCHSDRILSPFFHP